MLKALGAGAVARNGRRGAVAAASGDGLAVAAVMAREVAAGAVQHERDVAVQDSSIRARTSGTRGSSTIRAG